MDIIMVEDDSLSVDSGEMFLVQSCFQMTKLIRRDL